MTPPQSPDGASPPVAVRPDRAVEAGKGALFIGFAKVFFMLTGFVQKILLTRLVGAAEYGLFELVNGAVSIVNNTMVQGTIQSVSKFAAEDDSRVEAVKLAALRLQLGVGIVVAGSLGLAAPWLAGFHGASEHVGLYRLVALIPFSYAIYAVFVGIANGQRRFRVQAGFDVGFSSLKTVLLLGGAAAAGAAGALAGFVGAALIIVLVAARVVGLPGRKSAVASGAAAARFPIGRLVAFMPGIVAYTLLINLALAFDLQLLPYLARQQVDGARAQELAAFYGAMRTLAALPFQALLIVTFVIFPLVSRSTFEKDAEATAAYIRQTLRYALFLAAGMAVVLAARPAAVMATLFPPAFGLGAPALPFLVAGVSCLGLVGVAGSMINAAGRPQVAAAIVGLSVAVGAAAEFFFVPRATAGGAMLVAAASSTAVGMGVGLIAALAYLRLRFQSGPPLSSVLRVLLAVAVSVGVGRFFPTGGKVLGLAAMLLVGVVFFGVLIVSGEFGPQDREKFAKILRRRPG